MRRKTNSSKEPADIVLHVSERGDKAPEETNVASQSECGQEEPGRIQENPTCDMGTDKRSSSGLLDAGNNKGKPSAWLADMGNAFHNNWTIALIAITIIAYFVSLIFYSSYDNDIWFILASGREIIENGFPDMNPFAFREGMHVVIQQWIPDVMSYLVYSACGFVGLGLLLTLFIGVLIFSLYKLGRLIRGNLTGAEVILVFSGITLFGLQGYLSMRPHVYTMIAFVWVLYFCEKYKRTNNWKNSLVFLPIIVAVHINFHMAMTPFDLVIIGCYLIPDVVHPFQKRFRMLQSFSFGEPYGRLPLLITWVACAAAMLLNPYTLDGALYLVNSYGAAEYRNYINEMGTTDVWCYIGFAMMVNLVLGAISLGVIGKKNIHLPFTLLYLGCMVLSFQHVRNIWLVSFFAFPLIMLAAKDVSFEFKKISPSVVPHEKGMAVIFAISALVCTSIIFAMDAMKFENPESDSPDMPIIAMDYLDDAGVDRETARIYNGFNPGGYIEYRGYKCNMDPRPELWSPGITKLDFNYYTEFVDMVLGSYQDAVDYIYTYDFDYILANTDTDIHDFLSSDDNQGEYEIVAIGNDYNLWAKTKAESAPEPAQEQAD